MPVKTSIFCILSLTLLLLLTGLPTDTQATPLSVVNAPTLKWAYGGCFSSWCQTGWYASPAVANLDGDPQAEVIWGSYDVVALDGLNGALQWRASNDNRVWPGIALADLTGDGDQEIIVGRSGDQVTVYNQSGGVEWSHSPIFGSGEVRTLAVEDLETDGQFEVIVGRASGGETRQLNVLEANGSVRPGWPARRNGEPGYGWGMYNENVTVADLNNDGFKEIIGPTDTHYITALDRHGNQLSVNSIYSPRTVWSQVGVHVDQTADLRGYANCGTEHRPNFANSAPAIADVDGNGSLEIVVVGDVYNCAVGDPDGDMYHLPWILKLDRTRWNGSGFDWTVIPAAEPGSGPLSQDYNVIQNSVTNAVVADLDGDGLKEILYPSYDGRLHAYWLDKTEHGSWPYDVPGFRFASEPIVVDLDNTGDGHAEVIFTSWPQNGGNRLGQLHILDYLGNPLHILNLPAPRGDDWNGSLGAPTIANIDTDPDMELAIGTVSSGVVTYDLPGTANARILWGTGRGSFKRTGLSPIDESFSLNTTPSSQAIDPGNMTTYLLKVQSTGLFTKPVTLNITNPAPTFLSLNPTSSTFTPPGQVTLTVTDLHGPGQLLPGVWYTIPISASGGGITRTAKVSLLVGGTRTYLPIVLK
jgi:hypothetical protein